MRKIVSMWAEESGEGGVSGGAMVAIVILIVALILVLFFYRGGSAPADDGLDIDVDLDTSGSVAPIVGPGYAQAVAGVRIRESFDA